jgi:hypothetical protein
MLNNTLGLQNFASQKKLLIVLESFIQTFAMASTYFSEILAIQKIN